MKYKINFKKRTISLLLLVIFLFSGCAKTIENVETSTIETTSSAVELKTLSESPELVKILKELSNMDNPYYKRGPFTKIADNLYEVTYDEYDEKCLNVPPTLVDIQKLFAAPGACTSVRKGIYYGRNLDFVFGDIAEIVVRVPAKEGRYANVGLASSFEYVSPKAIDEGYIDTISQALIPLAVCDGINEKGVACNVNVVPAADLELWTKGTNMEKEDLNMFMIPRFVLDHAASAKEAIDLLKDKKIYIPWDTFGLRAKGMDLHIMIADKINTYVVEFINNEMQVVDLTDSDDRIMTNFYLALDEKTYNSAGIERYNIIKNQYTNINTMEEMKKAMESVKFSLCYGDENQNNIWYSDDGFLASDGTKITGENAEKYIDEAKVLAKKHQKALENNLVTKKNKEGYWITMHTSVFDLENKTIDICVQERYDKGYYKVKVNE